MLINAKVCRGITASVLSLVCAAAAFAGPSAPIGLQHSTVVHFSDLNLEQPQDVAKLYSRITLVADRLCGPRTLSGLYMKWADYASCYADTINSAVTHVNHPSLTAYYRQQWSRPVSRDISIAQQ